MLSERAQQMARLMVFEGMSQTDAYRASGYKGKAAEELEGLRDRAQQLIQTQAAASQ